MNFFHVLDKMIKITLNSKLTFLTTTAYYLGSYTWSCVEAKVYQTVDTSNQT